MGGSGETNSQRSERLAGQSIADKAAKTANQEKALQMQKAADEELKKKEKAARAGKMGGGGREGLMYRGNQAGVQA